MSSMFIALRFLIGKRHGQSPQLSTESLLQGIGVVPEGSPMRLGSVSDDQQLGGRTNVRSEIGETHLGFESECCGVVQ